MSANRIDAAAAPDGAAEMTTITTTKEATMESGVDDRGVADVGFDAVPATCQGLESAMPDGGAEPAPGDLAHGIAKARAALREKFPECGKPTVGHCGAVNAIDSNLKAVEMALGRAQDRIDERRGSPWEELETTADPGEPRGPASTRDDEAKSADE